MYNQQHYLKPPINYFNIILMIMIISVNMIFIIKRLKMNEKLTMYINWLISENSVYNPPSGTDFV